MDACLRGTPSRSRESVALAEANPQFRSHSTSVLEPEAPEGPALPIAIRICAMRKSDAEEPDSFAGRTKDVRIFSRYLSAANCIAFDSDRA
jgi:hypothetical protein